MKLRATAAAAMVGVMTCVGVQAQETITKTKVIQWRANNSWRSWSEEGTVRLVHSFIVPEDGKCRLFARDASWVDYHPGGGPLEGLVASPKRVEMFFEIPTTTKLRLWMLVRRARAEGTIELLEGVDATYGGSISWVRPELPDDDWHWIPGALREYRQGARELQLDRITPGMEIMTFALSPDDEDHSAEELEGWPEANVNLWPSGEAFTEYLSFAAVRRWRAARLTDVQLKGGRVGMRYSADHGETWEPVPEDGDLSGIALREDGTDDLRLRVWLIRAEDGTSPTCGPLELTYETEAGAVVTVEDGTARLSFDRQTGAIVGLENLVTGTVLCSPDVPSPLFQLDIKQPGYQAESEWEHLTSLDAKLVGGGIERSMADAAGKSARFDYLLELEDGTVEVSVRADFLGGGVSEWRAEVTNHLREREIAQLGYPVIGELRVSDEPEDDRLMIQAHYLWRIPAHLGRFCFWWPGASTAPWLDVFNEREGVALISHDETWRSTGQECKGVRRERCQLSLIKVLRLRPGGSFSGAPSVLRVHEGDWHHTMLAERPWFNERWQYDGSVGWIEEADGWHTEGWPCPRWSDLGEYCADLRARSGLNYVSFWNHQVPGTSWADPHFSPLNGSPEDVRRGIRRAHRAGMRVTFYIQSYLLDPAMEGMTRAGPVGYMQDECYWEGLPSLPEGFCEHNAERNPAGESRFWTPHEQEMCYGADEFGEYRYRWSYEIYNKLLGADGQYWDSPAHSAVCWAEEHGHEGDPGLAALAHYRNLERIKQAIRADDPSAVVVGEGRPSGLLSQTLDFALDNAPTLAGTRMLYPRLKILLGTSDGKDPRWHEAHLLGCRLDGYNEAKYPEHRGIMWVRQRTGQYLYPADFRDTMGIEIDGPESVKACLHICDEARTTGAAVTVLNPEGVSDARISVDTSEFGPVRVGWVVSSDMTEAAIELTPGEETCSFVAPEALASTVLLLERAEPRVRFEQIPPVARGGQTEVRAVVESLDGRPCAGELAVQTREGLSSRPVRFRAEGAGEQGARVRLMLAADDTAAEGLADLPVRVSVDGGPSFTRSLSVYVDDEPVHCQARWWGPELLRVTLSNQALVAHRGELTLRGIEGEPRLVDGAPWQFELAPGQSESRDFELVGAADAQLPWTVRGQASYGRHSSQVHQTCWPGVLNGSMERHIFRKPDFSGKVELTGYGSEIVPNIPDWWWGQFSDRSPRLSRNPSEHPVAFDNQTAFDGQWSLRLEPSEDRSVMQYLFVGVQPETRYRISAHIRRLEHHPKTGMALVQRWTDQSGQQQSRSDQLGYVTEGPLGEWVRFETHATTVPGNRYCSLYFYAHGTGAVWVDEVRMVPDNG